MIISLEDIDVFVSKSFHFCHILKGGSREQAKIELSFERFIFRPSFLHEKCLVFHALSTGANFEAI